MTVIVTDPGLVAGKRKVPNRFGTYEVRVERDGTVIQAITVYPVYYIVGLTTYILLQIVLLLVALLFGNLNDEYSWGGALLGIQILHFLGSWSFVKENEIAGLLMYGRPLQEVERGIVFTPFGLFQLKKLNNAPLQAQFPGEPEKVWKKSDKDYFTLPEAERERFVLPIRALSAPTPKGIDRGDEANTLQSQMTLELNFYVRLSIEHFWVFITRMVTLEEAKRQLRDSGERVLIEEVAVRTPAMVNAEIGTINLRLRAELEKITEDWGVAIVEATMLSPDITHTVNSGMQSVVVAKTEATKTVISANAEAERILVIAEATKQKLSREGEGRAAAQKAELEALAKTAKRLGVDIKDVLDLEKARALAGGKTTIFVDGGGQSSIMGIGARLATGAKTTSTKNEGE